MISVAVSRHHPTPAQHQHQDRKWGEERRESCSGHYRWAPAGQRQGAGAGGYYSWKQTFVKLEVSQSQRRPLLWLSPGYMPTSAFTFKRH